jgi:hypothetical protein
MAPAEKISCTSVVENEQPRGNMHLLLFRRLYQGHDMLDTGRDGACWKEIARKWQCSGHSALGYQSLGND